MKLYLYTERDSFLHRLNPLTKFAVNIPLIVLLAAILDPVTPAVFSVLIALALVALGRIPVPVLIRSLWPFALAGVGLLWTTAVFYQTNMAGGPPQVVVALGPLSLTGEGLWYSLSITLRLLAIFLASTFFVLTTEPTAFVLALVQQWRLPYRIGYGILAAYRFVPMLDGELETIRAAHKVRGVREGGGLWTQYQRVKGYAIPLLATGIRKAERVALAMDCRAFAARPDRTYYRPMAFGRADLLFAAGFVVVTAAVLVALSRLGLLGALVPLATPRIGS